MSEIIRVNDLIEKSGKPTRARRRVPSLSDESESYRNIEISNPASEAPPKRKEIETSPTTDVQERVDKKRQQKFADGISKDKQLEVTDKKLAKIEKKTDKWMAKANKPTPVKKVKPRKEPTHNYDVYKQDQSPCYQLFIRLRKAPRAILEMIKERSYWNSDYQAWTSEIHTNEVLTELGISRSNFTTTLSRLGKRGWFKLDTIDKSGFRIVTIDISNYYSEDEVGRKNSTLQ